MEFKSKKPLVQCKCNEDVWMETPTLKTVTLFSKEPASSTDEDSEEKWVDWCFQVWDEYFRDKDGNKFTNIQAPKDLYDVGIKDLREMLNEFADLIYGKQTEKKSTN